MGFDQIIALDLGKFKSVACVMDAATRRHTFATVATTPAALHELLVKHATVIQHRRSLVGRRTQCKNGIRSIFSQQGMSCPSLPPAGTTTGPGLVGWTYIIWLPFVRSCRQPSS